MGVQTLWWSAGRLAYDMPQADWREFKWHDSLRQSARLLEPVWPQHYSSGHFSYALPTVSLLLYAGPYDDFAKAEDVLVGILVTDLNSNGEHQTLDGVIRAGLERRGHDLAASDDPISGLFRGLTHRHEALVTAIELPSFLQPRSGTRLVWGAEWAAPTLAAHYLSDAAAS